ncbi:MAG: chromosomal replication initiator protein DnaA [Bacteroidales bacterium]|nr:chromosomal replication initiator protein DnaA [Bacteroidales bacterium]
MDNSVRQIWDNCLQFIKNNINANSFRMWFQPIVPVKVDGSTLTVQVPSHFVYEYLEDNYVELLHRALQTELGPDAKLIYNIVVDKRAPKGTFNIPGNRNSALPHQPPTPQPQGHEIQNPFVTRGIQKIPLDSRLNPLYTMENFVEGDCNKLGRRAAESIANKPGHNPFNPFMIFGNSGMGKTHLAQAIGNSIKEKFPDKVVLYVEANKFQTQYTDSCRNNTRNDFVHFYQMLDVLIIDDVQEFAGKVGTQDTFFAIFNSFYMSGKQIILTCDTKPVELKGLNERLLTRFRCGLTVEVSMPDYETRLNILKRKAYNDGMIISEDILKYMAETVVSNVRDLEGALISLLAHSTFNRTELTLEVAKQLLGKITTNNEPEKYTIEHIIKTVCSHFGIKEQVLSSKSRAKEIATARQLAMYFAKQLTELPYKQIGIAIGNRDHSTVLYACKTVAKQIEKDDKFKEMTQEVENKIKSSQE